jgi:hypothetical protein
MLQLSTVYRNCIKLFFKYKGSELNKPLLESTYTKYGHSETQNYDTNDKPRHNIDKIEKLKTQSLLNFTVNLDLDLENTKLTKSEVKPVPAIVYDAKVRDIVNELKRVTGEASKAINHQSEEKLKIVDLQGSKYSLLYHLGEDKLKTICSRTESLLKFTENRVYPDKPLTNEQEELRNIVAFYSK